MTQQTLLRVITIVTDDYLRHTARMVTSFLKYHPEGEVLVFCENNITASFLRSDRCRIMTLPSIRHYGVKRAKFEAYRIAMEEGGFLYLDSDIIVTGTLNSLIDDSALVACRDDLSGCDFIADRQYPWTSRPDLKAIHYFNSGVFYAPVALADFFTECHKASLDNIKWAELIIPEKLLDNHFLCGMVNDRNPPIRYVEEKEFNWQGLRRHDQIMATLLDGNIINVETQKPLRLLHFAGISEIDKFLLRLPMEIINIVANAVTVGSGDWLSFVKYVGQSAQKLDSTSALALIRALVAVGAS